MSTEQEGKARLTALLADLSNHITPVSCVRHPVDQFRSHVQRFLKHRNGPFPPNDIRLRETIIATDAAFGGTQKLIASDHKPPHSGDIVCDFATRFLSPWVSPTEPPSPDTNVGLSTEALVLMARPHAEAGGDFEAARVVPAQEPPQLTRRATLLAVGERLTTAKCLTKTTGHPRQSHTATT